MITFFLPLAGVRYGPQGLIKFIELARGNAIIKVVDVSRLAAADATINMQKDRIRTDFLSPMNIIVYA